MFENYIITTHVVNRYLERVSETQKDAIKRIRYDLSYKRVKRIVNIGNTRHVFTVNSKEFIFVKSKGRWFLKTVVKRSREATDRTIEKRIRTSLQSQTA
jgi:hypothetical protein